MNNEELKSLIDGHAAAMKAQVDDPGVRLEYRSYDGVWVPRNPSEHLRDGVGAACRNWTRLAPAPKLVPLDQSDFLGEGRVTHVRLDGSVYAVVVSTPRGIAIGAGFGSTPYESLGHWQCSRDFGASFGPCSKAEVMK